jgi:Fic family protein
VATLPDPAERFRIERVWWTPTDYGLGSRGRPAHIDAYVPAPIAVDDIEVPASVLDQIDAARAALDDLASTKVRHRLDGAARQLMRSEAIASSRIEAHVIGHRALARAASPLTGDAHGQADAVLGNLRAIDRAATTAGALDVDGVLELHRELFEGTIHEPGAGALRTEQNWIGGRADSPRNAEFVPPPPEYVAPLMDDLVEFMSRDDLPPVVQAAVAHAQFETIHPFADGNGRVGRALVHVVLLRRGAVPDVTLPISLVLLARGDRYVRGLTSWRGSARADWLSFFAGVVHESAIRASQLGDAIDDLVARWMAQAGSPRAGSTARQLVELLPSMPILDVATASSMLGVSDESARRALNQLDAAGVVRQRGTDRARNRIWECVGLYAVLDEFERMLLDGVGPGAAATT